MTFKKYVLNWWNEFIEDHKSDLKRLMETFVGEEETIEDYLEDNETPYDWLSAKDDADEIYKHFFGYEGEQLYFDDLPDTETFLEGMFKQAYTEKYDFVNKLIEDMVEHACNYSLPYSFFHDLSYGGCVSGIIGMFVYNSDCKEFYIDHIDDLETFVENLEESLGEPIKNKDHLPHYTFVCWLCYEELGHNIAQILYPERF